MYDDIANIPYQEFVPQYVQSLQTQQKNIKKYRPRQLKVREKLDRLYDQFSFTELDTNPAVKRRLERLQALNRAYANRLDTARSFITRTAESTAQAVRNLRETIPDYIDPYTRSRTAQRLADNPWQEGLGLLIPKRDAVFDKVKQERRNIYQQRRQASSIPSVSSSPGSTRY